MLDTKSVVSLVKYRDYITINYNDTFLQLSDVAFDAATFEIWGALLNGDRWVILRNKSNLLVDVKEFGGIILNNYVTILWLTKSLFDQLF